MFKKSVKTAVAALAVTALLSSCGGTGLPNYDYEIDMEPYKNAVTVTDKTYLILVNKENPCGETYAPSELTALSGDLTLYGKEVKLEENAALAAEALIRELHARGYEDIVITSGYRDYAYQQVLFNTYLGNEMAKHPDWTEEMCRAEVLTYSALPGESEHQTGLCMDLISTGTVVLDETFAENPAYAPIKVGDVLGKVTIVEKNDAGDIIANYGTMDLVASSDLERSAILYYLHLIKTFFSNIIVRIISIVIILAIIAYIIFMILQNNTRRRRRIARRIRF